MDRNINIQSSEVIHGHRRCQNSDAKWLMIENLYEKCYRPNFYDIGGSYIEDDADLWFTCKTEIVGKLFLLHIFVTNHSPREINLSLACKNNFILKKNLQAIFLYSMHKKFEFEEAPEFSCKYIFTYSFTEGDVELFKNLKCYISIAISRNSPLSVPNNKVTEKQDFKALLNDPIGSDFVIESSDGVKFNVHQYLLTSHSEVFKAMLKENTVESKDKYMKMIDVESDDLKHILHFMYTGTIENLEGCNFFNLMMLGDKYDLKGLIEISKYGLMCEMNKENVFEILAVADLYNNDELKLAALKYIKNYKITLEDSLFEEINNIKLLKEICKFISPCA